MGIKMASFSNFENLTFWYLFVLVPVWGFGEVNMRFQLEKGVTLRIKTGNRAKNTTSPFFSVAGSWVVNERARNDGGAFVDRFLSISQWPHSGGLEAPCSYTYE